MTWAKRIDSRAYDPASLTTVTPSAGTVSTVTFPAADFTVVNDYFCIFNIAIYFTQVTAAAARYEFNLPLPIRDSGASSRWCFGSGYILDGVAATVQDATYVSQGSTSSTCYVEVPVAISVGANHRLVVAGHYPIR